MSSDEIQPDTNINENAETSQEDAENRSGKMLKGATDLIEAHPIAATAAAAAAGAMIGILLPRWRIGGKLGSTALKAGTLLATSDAARALAKGLANAGDHARSGARQLAAHRPNSKQIADTARQAVTRVVETARQLHKAAGEDKEGA